MWCSRFDVEVAVDHVLIARRDAEALQLAPVAAQALGAGALVEHARDVRDAAVPELVQMAHGRGGARLVVGDDEARERAFDLEVDADRRRRRAQQPAHLLVSSAPISSAPSTLWWRQRLR